MIYIALHSSDNKNVDLNQIAADLDIPKHFLSKILQLLVKSKLLVSMKGPTGGFRLNRPSKKITLIEVIEAIDGLDMFNQCGIGFKRCNDKHPCPIHFEYKNVRDRIEELFKSKTLKELTEEIETGDSIISLGKPMGTD